LKKRFRLRRAAHTLLGSGVAAAVPAKSPKKNAFPTPGCPPALPRDVRIYAIGDIHGCVNAFDAILMRIANDIKRNPIQNWRIVTLGDYLDRGPASREVVERLIKLAELNCLIALRGNHDIWFDQFIQDPETFRALEPWGAYATLASYGLKPISVGTPDRYKALAAQFASVLPSEHAEFLRRLPTHYICGDYVFVHAGLRPGAALRKQKVSDLIGIRRDFLDHDRTFEKFVVHGHTPVQEPDIRANRINIDTGAYATNRLTCLVLEGAARRFLFSDSPLQD
jgi:serine/threonine protein phosphatase 1